MMCIYAKLTSLALRVFLLSPGIGVATPSLVVYLFCMRQTKSDFYPIQTYCASLTICHDQQIQTASTTRCIYCITAKGDSKSNMAMAALVSP